MSSSDISKSRAEAVITVHAYQPVSCETPADGPSLTRIHVEEAFSGDIEGDGVVEFLQAARPTVRRASSESSGSPAPWRVAPEAFSCRIRAR
jgi:hypothetical protein